MPAGAPKGNKNAVGNRGNRKSGLDLVKYNNLKGKILDFCIDVMDNGDYKEKKEVAMKLANTVFPRAVELSGENGGAIPVAIYERIT